MKAAVAGLPQSGKTTVFNILTGRREEVGAFATKTAIAVVPVPDPRLDRIWEDYKPLKKVYPSITVHDLPSGMKESEVLAALREMDVLLVVLRAFGNECDGSTGALSSQAAELQTRLAVADMQVMEKRLERIEKLLKRPSPERESQLREQRLLGRMLPLVEEGRSLSGFEMTADERRLVTHYGFLTLKPLVYMLNTDEELAASPPSWENAIVVFGKLEMEICQLSEDEQQAFLAEYGICRTASEIVSRCYAALNAITFFTTGDEEVRGWTVCDGTLAAEAAGEIHSEMEKGFIKAEVVSYDKFVEIGSLKEARTAAGRLENRDYAIRDGDIVTVRFSR